MNQVKLISNCPVCKGTVSYQGQWYQTFGSAPGKVRVSFMVDMPFFTQGGKILCSPKCDGVYRDAKQRANAAYNNIMADYQ